MKKLKIGFAMGGGVSLGTFSGAALTESIKQLIIFGGFKDPKTNRWRKYGEVEIDVFSGASAGAISLAIMLRMFCHYEDKLKLLRKTKRFKHCKTDEKVMSEIEKMLRNKYGAHFEKLSATKKNQVISIQVGQEFQRYCWVNRSHIRGLIGLKGEGIKAKPLTTTGSLLNKQHLVDLAKETLMTDEPDLFINKKKGKDAILANRVLFACTLTRLEQKTIDGSGYHFADLPEEEIAIYRKIMVDGISSDTHRDVRVFDINFSDIAEEKRELYPNRWMKYHSGESEFFKNQNGKKQEINTQDHILRVNSTKLWKEVTATAMACGAFPVAFEPAVLERYGYEYGEDEFDFLKDVYTENEIEMRRKYPFSFIDGGTFNNEPIREAFRLASFIDTIDDDIPGRDYDRIILYVDPFITEPTQGKTKAYYYNYKMNQSTGKVYERQGLEKMNDFVGPLIGMLLQEGAISELDKSVGILNKFELQRDLKKFYAKSMEHGIVVNPKVRAKSIQNNVNQLIIETRNQVKRRIDGLSKKMSITSISLGFEQEVKRLLTPDYAEEFYPKLCVAWKVDRKKVRDIPGYTAFFESEKPLEASMVYFKEWLIILNHIALDIALNLTGKNSYTKLIPIGPIDLKDGKPSLIPLQGQKIAGFYGFFSEKLRRTDFETGIKATFDVLKFIKKIRPPDDFIIEKWKPKKVLTAENILTKKEQIEIEDLIGLVVEKRVQNELLSKNLTDMMTFGDTGIKDELLDGIKRMIIKAVRKTVAEGLKNAFINFDTNIKYKVEIRLIVPNSPNFQLSDSKQTRFDTNKIKVNKKTILIAPSVLEESGKWIGYNIINKNLIKIVSNKKMKNDKTVLILRLPSVAFLKKVKAFSYPVFEIDLAKVLNNATRLAAFKKQAELEPDSVWTIKNNIKTLASEL
jgi:predicted acylesterase/phospholipase RssA